jgi:GntP family gluconate:H+ symporter
MLVVHRSKGAAMRLGIPALAGLSVLHGFIPPHPGPLAAIGILHANVGVTLALGLVIAIPAVAVAGPLFGAIAAQLVPIGAAGAGFAVTGAVDETTPASTGAKDPEATRSPSFAMTLFTLLTPLGLMLLKAAADIWMAKTNSLRPALDFIGDPVTALLIGVLLAMVTFGTNVGFSVNTLGRKIGASLATGSATVATVTAAGIIAPLAVGLSPTRLSLVVLAIGAGSLFFSHVNDAGFWLVKEYFGLSVGQTIKTWSVMETIISVMGLVLTLLLSVVFH